VIEKSITLRNETWYPLLCEEAKEESLKGYARRV
jgi:hypothetical protein